METDWPTGFLIFSLLLAIIHLGSTQTTLVTGATTYDPTVLPTTIPDENATTPEPKTKLTIGLLSNLFGENTGTIFVAGGISYAVAEINDDPDILPDYELEIVRQNAGWTKLTFNPFSFETGINELSSIKGLTTLGENHVNVVIGPDEFCTTEARIAAAWDMPMISYACSASAVSDKELYPTFSRTYPTDALYASSILSVLQEFNWDSVTIVNGLDAPWTSTANRLLEILPANNITIESQRTFEADYIPLYFKEEEPRLFDPIIEETYQTTRIYILLCHQYARLAFMGGLETMGLLTNGEYMVITVDTEEYTVNPDKPYLYRDDIYENYPSPLRTRSARSLLILAPRPPADPEGYADFVEKCKEYRQNPPFGFNAPNAMVAPESAYLYSAVWVYARALQQVLDEGGSIVDGEAIIQKTLGMVYRSPTGIISKIDQHGDVGANLTLLSLQEANYTPGYDFRPVAVFNLDDEHIGANDTTDQLLYVKYGNYTIQWIAGFPPRAVPICGFRGELCPTIPNYTPEIAGGTIGGLFLILLIVLGLVYRNWKYEQALASLIWKIDYREIKMKDSINASQFNIGSRMSMRSIDSGGSGGRMQAQIFTLVGTYRGQVVAIQKINKKSVDLTRNLRKEFKALRDLKHDNINPFVGACVDPPNIAIVSEYCSRGSLQDILENDEINLDNMFRAALVGDILKGMIYIHNSSFKSHGNLKSSNCVVDSRWVLKITGFGLTNLKEGAKKDINEIGEHAFYQNMLWTAPELLRMSNPPLAGTQKGDIYSFGIILYEIALRNGPYGQSIYTPYEIVERLKNPPDPLRPIRPLVSSLHEVDTPEYYTAALQTCWNESPEARPDFKEVRVKLKEMQKGMKSNIFDNMIKIMEKYANNLESIVEERTGLLIEEKKKTDQLLNSMLPKSVANTLKRGAKVDAEAFEGVTIYFSDIVGFTKLSSESTPWQVIDLLNDLYTVFDSTIKNYDAYKVETIGDAYMLVSGLPIRNGDRHAAEIASASIHLLEEINRFEIRHKPGEQLRLRIGIHSGPVCAGVVGLTMPRYCLFGDTVNTASRMESNGQPQRIHCSPTCRALLVKIGGYDIEERGLVAMKGKGEVLTYWINGQDPSYKRESVVSAPDIQPESVKNEPAFEIKAKDTSAEENVGVGETIELKHEPIVTVDGTGKTHEPQKAWGTAKPSPMPSIEEPTSETQISLPSTEVPPNTPEQTGNSETGNGKAKVDDVDETKQKHKKKKKKKKKKKSKDKDKDNKDKDVDSDDVLELEEHRRISTDSRTALLDGKKDAVANGQSQKVSTTSDQIPLIDIIAPGSTVSQTVQETDPDRTKQKDSLTDSGVGNSREGSNHEVPM
ncbi:guanylate cyclase 32E [Saccoglossus kowalevskii]